MVHLMIHEDDLWYFQRRRDAIVPLALAHDSRGPRAALLRWLRFSETYGPKRTVLGRMPVLRWRAGSPHSISKVKKLGHDGVSHFPGEP